MDKRPGQLLKELFDALNGKTIEVEIKKAVLIPPARATVQANRRAPENYMKGDGAFSLLSPLQH